jgi:hypothetical protein
VTANTEDPHILKKMLALPPDWWQNVSAASTLRDWFKGHILALFVAGSVNGSFQFAVYSGILFDHDGTLVWITAGHVVEELATLITSPHFRASKICWLDDYHVTAASALPLHRTDIPMKSWRDTGLDLGALLPSVLDAGNIRLNDNVHPITARIWHNLNPAKVEGYYAVGFPGPWVQHSETPKPNRKTLHSVSANLACLPLKEIPPPVEMAHEQAWADPGAFYGRIIPFLDYPEFQVDTVRGMSGGPVLSVERNSDGRIVYRLVGIIEAWSPSLSVIRAEPVRRVAAAIEAWLAEV